MARHVASMQWVAMLASWIGDATFAANHGKEAPHRDSTAERARRWGLDVGGEGVGKAGKREKGAEVKPLRPQQLGGASVGTLPRGVAMRCVLQGFAGVEYFGGGGL